MRILPSLASSSAPNSDPILSRTDLIFTTMFFPLIILAIVFCAISIYLPYSAGLTRLEKKKKQQKQTQSTTTNDFHGYIPPDEELRRQREQDEQLGLKARASALKEKLNVTSDEIPFLIRLNQGDGLRKRNDRNASEKVVTDQDPNDYDYDLDELIEDETQQAYQENVKAAYVGQSLGGDKEAMV